MLDLLHTAQPITDAIGIAGFLLYILSFNLVQMGRLCGNSVLYAAMNVAAAAFVLISLVNAFNVASFLIQVSFITIGIVGILRKRQRTRATSNPQLLAQTAR